MLPSLTTRVLSLGPTWKEETATSCSLTTTHVPCHVSTHHSKINAIKCLKQVTKGNNDKYLRRRFSELRVTIVASVACSEISFARASEVLPYKLKHNNDTKKENAQTIKL